MRYLKKIELVLLDRDGILNSLVFRDLKWRAPIQNTEIELAQSVQEVLLLLRQNFDLAIVSNQPDFDRLGINKMVGIEILSRIANLLDIRNSFVCFHGHNLCKCRKPEPGLLVLAMEMLGKSAHNTVLVGDRWTDVLAAKKVGVTAILKSRNLLESFSPTSDGSSPPRNLRPDYIIQDIDELPKLLESINADA